MAASDPQRAPWLPAGWRGFPATQLPAYPDSAAAEQAESILRTATQVAAPADSERLLAAMAKVPAGGGFVLQGGDCAESFDDPVGEKVASLAGLFDSMAMDLDLPDGQQLI